MSFGTQRIPLRSVSRFRHEHGPCGCWASSPIPLKHGMYWGWGWLWCCEAAATRLFPPLVRVSRSGSSSMVRFATASAVLAVSLLGFCINNAPCSSSPAAIVPGSWPHHACASGLPGSQMRTQLGHVS